MPFLVDNEEDGGRDMHVSGSSSAFLDFAYSKNRLSNNVVSLVAATS